MGEFWTLTEEQRLRRAGYLPKARAAKAAKRQACIKAESEAKRFELEEQIRKDKAYDAWGKVSILDRLLRRG